MPPTLTTAPPQYCVPAFHGAAQPVPGLAVAVAVGVAVAGGRVGVGVPGPVVGVGVAGGFVGVGVAVPPQFPTRVNKAGTFGGSQPASVVWACRVLNS